MSKQFRMLVAITAMCFVAFAAGCAGMYEIGIYDLESTNTLTTEKFAIVLEKMTTNVGYKDYYMAVTVRNITDQEQVFTCDDMEIYDPASGMSFYCPTKGGKTVSLNSGQIDIILQTTLGAGKMTSGRLWFVTPIRKATAESLVLSYNEYKLQIDRD